MKLEDPPHVGPNHAPQDSESDSLAIVNSSMSHSCSETLLRENEHEMIPWEDGNLQAKQGARPPSARFSL